MVFLVGITCWHCRWLESKSNVLKVNNNNQKQQQSIIEIKIIIVINFFFFYLGYIKLGQETRELVHRTKTAKWWGQGLFLPNCELDGVMWKD